jgi:hypothetical protein
LPARSFLRAVVCAQLSNRRAESGRTANTATQTGTYSGRSSDRPAACGNT